MMFEASGTIEYREFCLMTKNKIANTKDDPEFSEECELREAFKYILYNLLLESYCSNKIICPQI